MIEHVAVITGVQDEADALLHDQPATRLDSPFGAIRQLDHGGKRVTILCSGIGKVHAGAAALYMHGHFCPDLFLVIGTAGHVSTIQGDCFYLHESLQADCFVKCPERSAYLRDTLMADLVDMETAAVAQIAAMLDLPWAGIKAVTDGANSDSSGDFHANLSAAARRAADAAAEFISRI